MCFSAGASFGASAVVAVAGAVSASRIGKKNQIMFALIPAIFALQQFIEGLVWITFNNQNYRHWQYLPVATFLALAQVVWPVWVPLSMLKVEEDVTRRKILKAIFLISCVLAPLQAFRLIFYPATAEVTTHHIHYALDFSIPYFGLVLNIFYFITTIVPPFISSQRSVRMLGLFNLVSFILTAIFFEKNVVSVWCFFAALISWQVIVTMKHIGRKPSLERVV